MTQFRSFFRKFRFMKYKTFLILFIALSFIGFTSLSYSYTIPSSNKPAYKSENLGYLQRLSLGLSELAAATQKAIVYISTSKTVDNQFGGMDPFDFFFGIPRDSRPQPKKQQGAGSGFIIDLQKGYIITNNHVIENSDEIVIKFTNNEKYDGEIVGRDSNTDIAVIKVKEKNFKKQGLGELKFHSGKIKVGELAVALGAPFSLESSITLGVVSATDRNNLQITNLEDFLQTDAAINPGNSGGPLVNIFGNVIGVNTAIASTRSGGSAGVGFAIPASLAKSYAEKLIKDGKVERGYIGIQMQVLTEELAKSLDLPANQKGVLVNDIMSDGPAISSGIEPGDVIIELDKKPISNSSELVLRIGTKAPGTVVNLVVLRKNKKLPIKMTIAAWPGQNSKIAGDDEKSSDKKNSALGMKFVKLNDALRLRSEIKTKEGFYIQSVEDDSVAFKAGVRQGDVLVTVNKKRAKSISDLKKMLKQKTLLIRIERSGSYLFVAINQ